MNICDSCNTTMKPSIKITDAEWEIMGVVWRDSPVSAKSILDSIGNGRRWSLATVRTLLRRLTNKGALNLSLDGKRYLYRPAVAKESAQKSGSKS